MKKIFLTLLILYSVSACAGNPSQAAPESTEAPVAASEIVPKLTPICISSEPAQKDIDRALTFTGELFSAPEWTRSYTVADGRVSVFWSNDPLGVVAYLEALIFPCGYEEPDLDNFFNDENWQIIFANYDSYEPVSECKRDDGLRLYEFTAVTAGFDYNINYWAQNDTDTRVISVMTVFPVESQSLMDEYSARLFPNFISCP